MQSSYGPAITHVQGGLKILYEVKYNEETHRHQHAVFKASKIPYISIQMLEEIFVRLDFQVSQVRFIFCVDYIVLTEVDG